MSTSQQSDRSDAVEDYLKAIRHLQQESAPVSTSAEATNFVNKTILYENTPHPNATTAAWMGENLHRGPDVWGADALDLVESQSGISSPPHNWTLTKRFDRDDPNDPSKWHVEGHCDRSGHDVSDAICGDLYRPQWRNVNVEVARGLLKCPGSRVPCHCHPD